MRRGAVFRMLRLAEGKRFGEVTRSELEIIGKWYMKHGDENEARVDFMDPQWEI